MIARQYTLANRTVHTITSAEATAVIDLRQPFGLFLCEEEGGYTAIDNGDGSAWVEVFKNREIAIAWLAYDWLDFEDAHHLDDALTSIKEQEGERWAEDCKPAPGAAPSSAS